MVQEETTLITNYTFQSVFDVLLLPSALLFFGRGADFNCGTPANSLRARSSLVCCHQARRAAGLGAAHRPGHVLMAPLSYKAGIVFHVILVNFAAGKGISFPCELLISLPQRGGIDENRERRRPSTFPNAKAGPGTFSSLWNRERTLAGTATLL